MTGDFDWPIGEQPAEETPADDIARLRSKNRVRIIATVALIAVVLVAAPVLLWIF